MSNTEDYNMDYNSQDPSTPENMANYRMRSDWLDVLLDATAYN